MEAYSLHSTDRNQIIQRILDTGIAPSLIRILSNNEETVVKATLSVLKIILCGSDDHKKKIVNCNIMLYLHSIVNHQDRDLRTKAIELLGLVAADSETQKQELIDLGFLSDLLANLVNEDLVIKKHKGRLFSCLAVNADKTRIHHIVAAGLIKEFYSLIENQDAETVAVSGSKLLS